MPKPPIPQKPALPAPAPVVPVPTPPGPPQAIASDVVTAAPAVKATPATNPSGCNKTLTFPALVLKAMHELCSDDLTRKEVSSLYVDMRDGFPILVATDGKIMGTYHLQVEGKNPECVVTGCLPDGIQGFMIPASCLVLPGSWAVADAVTVECNWEKKQVSLESKVGKTTHAIEGIYPNWRQVWPKDNSFGWMPEDKPCGEFAIAFTLLERLATAVKLVAKVQKSVRTGIKILPAKDDKTPVRVYFDDPASRSEFRAIVVPLNPPK
jgi:hypothetical protein